MIKQRTGPEPSILYPDVKDNSIIFINITMSKQFTTVKESGTMYEKIQSFGLPIWVARI